MDAHSSRTQSAVTLTCIHSVPIIRVDWYIVKSLALGEESSLELIRTSTEDGSFVTSRPNELTVRNISGDFEGQYLCQPIPTSGPDLPMMPVRCITVTGMCVFEFLQDTRPCKME